MENNLSQKAEEVIAKTTPQVAKPGVMTMPKMPHRSFFKKPIFVVLVLIVLLIILSAVFTLFNVGRFKKPIPYTTEPMNDAEYNQLVDKLTDEGFFSTAQVDEKKLDELQKEYESDERFINKPITDETRQNILDNSGTVVQEN